jgi:hypothetical protein
MFPLRTQVIAYPHLLLVLQIDAQIEQANTDARRGPGVETLQDDELFVLDTEPSQQTLAKLAKRRKKEIKPLRSQLVLESIGQGIKAVNPAATKHKQKGQLLKKHQQLEEAAAGKAAAPAKRTKQQPALDVWDRPPPDADKPDFLPEMRSTAYKASAHKHRAALVPAAPLIKAVEIDPAGCSFNPDREQHQDAVALLVASEMKKVLAQELAPVAPPAEADADYRRLSELEQLLVEAEADEEQEEEGEGGEERPRKKRKQAAAAAGQQGEEQQAGDDSGSCSGDDDEGSEDGFGAATGSKRHSAKKSKQDRNREAKRKALEAQLAAKKALKKQRRELDALKNLQVGEGGGGAACVGGLLWLMRWCMLQLGPSECGLPAQPLLSAAPMAQPLAACTHAAAAGRHVDMPALLLGAMSTCLHCCATAASLDPAQQSILPPRCTTGGAGGAAGRARAEAAAQGGGGSREGRHPATTPGQAEV